MITSKHTHGARKICPSHHFPVYTCTFEVGTVNIYKPFPEILCAFLGQPKNSVLSIFGQSCQPSWSFFFIFVIRITYQCLRKELAKTEHAINLPPPYRSVYMQAWHLLPWLKAAIMTVYLNTIFSPIPLPNLLGNASLHYYDCQQHASGEWLVELWLSTACQNL